MISGNTQAGVYIYEFQGAQGAPTTGNVVAGNFIGTNEADTAPLANGYGVLIASELRTTGSASTRSTAPRLRRRERDSGSTYAGVLIENSGTTGNVVAGDLIGTDAAGTQAIPNVNGVLIFGGASGDTIGGTATPARNVVSGNTNAGVYLSDSGTTDNVVLGNYIGTNATGTAPCQRDRPVVGGGASGNTIGGTIAAAANVASGNTDYGVAIESSGTSGNLIEGNYVGTAAPATRRCRMGWPEYRSVIRPATTPSAGSWRVREMSFPGTTTTVSSLARTGRPPMWFWGTTSAPMRPEQRRS